MRFKLLIVDGQPPILFRFDLLQVKEMGRGIVGFIVALWVIPISLLVNTIVFDPYMDEIFHIPQAQEYCKGNFKSWDPMITTPPGLYYLSLAHIASLFPGMVLLRRIPSFSDMCSTAILRSTNGALAIICSVLVYNVLTLLRPTLDRKKAVLYSIVLALYPLHWFCTFLYYTDVASLTVFLAMYLASLQKRYFFSALLGAVAIIIRQTNVIWMLFVAFSSIIDMMLVDQEHYIHLRKFGVTTSEEHRKTHQGDFIIPGLRKRKMKNTVNPPIAAIPSEASVSKSHLSGLFDEIQFILIQSWRLKWDLLVSFGPFIFVLCAFAAFVYWNGSVVLGAKEAHAVSPHFSQMLYFSLVSALFSAPFHFTFTRALTLLRSFWKNRWLSFAVISLAFAAALLSVHYFSIAHPYLEADNRHYPFYIWRKVIQVQWSMKYLLVPLYVYSWVSILDILGKDRSKIWVLAYLCACAAVLVPAPLIEFRYYTIPFFVFMLNCRIDQTFKWLLIGIVFIAINGFTMWMFLFRPFHWDHEPGTQRFIW